MRQHADKKLILDTRACLFDAYKQQPCRADVSYSCHAEYEGWTRVCARSWHHHRRHPRGGLSQGAAHLRARDGLRGAERHPLAHGALPAVPSPSLLLIAEHESVGCQHHQCVECCKTVTLVKRETRLDLKRCGAADGAGVAGVLCAPAAPGQHAGPDGVRVCGRGGALLKTGIPLHRVI